MSSKQRITVMRSQEATYGECRWAHASGTTVYDAPIALEFAAQLPHPRSIILPAVFNLLDTWYIGERVVNRIRLISAYVRRQAGRLWLALSQNTQPFRTVSVYGLLGAEVLVDPDGIGLWNLVGSA